MNTDDRPTRTDMLQVIDDYGDLPLRRVFAYLYNRFASYQELTFRESLTPERLDQFLQMLELESLDFIPFLRRSVLRAADVGKPHAKQDIGMTFQCRSLPILFFIGADREGCESCTFYYDLDDGQATGRVQQLCEKIGGFMRLDRKPEFSVLVYRHNRYETEEVPTLPFEGIEIGQQYNDDFLPIHEVITNSLEEPKSGLILLYGVPGTGKTTYIKHLISATPDRKFIFVPNEFVKELFSPNFIAFLLECRDAILIIEDAEKVVAQRDGGAEDSVVANILQLTDGLFSDFLNIKVICTFNSPLQQVDPALLRKGRLLAHYAFQPLSAEKSERLLKSLGKPVREGSLSLAEIFHPEKNGDVLPTQKKVGF